MSVPDVVKRNVPLVSISTLKLLVTGNVNGLPLFVQFKTAPDAQPVSQPFRLVFVYVVLPVYWFVGLESVCHGVGEFVAGVYPNAATMPELELVAGTYASAAVMPGLEFVAGGKPSQFVTRP